MTDYAPNLEDFLQWEDNEEDVDPTSTSTTKEENDNEEVDLIGDDSNEQTDNEEATETQDDVETQVPDTNEEEVQEESEDSKSQVELVYDIMSKSGLLTLPEEFKFDGSVDKLAEALDITKQNMQLEMAQNLWDKLPDNFKVLLEYGLAGGTDLNKVTEVVEGQVDTSKLDVENEKDQRYIVETYLKKTTKFTQDKINKRINMLYESDMLEDEANDNLKELKAFQEEERKKLVQSEIDRKQLEKEELTKAYEVFTDITSKLDIAEPRKKQILQAVWDTAKYDGKNNTSLVEHIDNQIRNNPEHFAQLVNIYLDYDPKEGFKDVGKSNRKATTNAAKNLRNTLQDLLNGNNVVKAVSSSKKDGSGFDFEQFIKYS